MRSFRPWLIGAAASVAFASIGLVLAEDTRQPTLPAPEKPLASALLDTLAGSWTTESTSTHDGKPSKGTGKSTFHKEIGGTALLQEYEATMIGPDGKSMEFFGHGVTKVAADGRSATTWWFCNMSPDVLKLTGSLTEDRLDLRGTSPEGKSITVTFEKTADGVAFRMSDGTNEMRETYKRSAAVATR